MYVIASGGFCLFVVCVGTVGVSPGGGREGEGRSYERVLRRRSGRKLTWTFLHMWTKEEGDVVCRALVDRSSERTLFLMCLQLWVLEVSTFSWCVLVVWHCWVFVVPWLLCRSPAQVATVAICSRWVESLCSVDVSQGVFSAS